ncbi:unnamed protein product [Allacma fusca]|uniref:C3H1-type domain-containing protein n=1 Tax=Allacma fusca TaxID=39272 RepID=A0A8J2J8Z5_9HEXA|nr:unnamed protein product [Allacma fusca]
MLPTLGLFRVFPCPYYVVGLCERPHCSFRHCRSDVEAARREASGFESDAKYDSGSEVGDDPDVTVSSTKTGKETHGVQKKEKKQESIVKNPSIDSLKIPVEKSTSSSKDTRRSPESKKVLKRDLDSNQELESPKKRIKLEEKSGLSNSNRKASLDENKILAENTVVFKEITQDSEQIKKEGSKSSPPKAKDSRVGSSEKDRKDSHSHKSHKHKHKRSHKDSHHTSSRHSSHRSNSSSSSSKKKDSHSSKSKISSSKHTTPKCNDKQESTLLSQEKGVHHSAIISSVGETFAENNNVRSSSIEISDTKGDEGCPLVEDLPDVPDDFLYPSDEEDDPDQIALECFNMFQNYKSDEKSVDLLKLETVPDSKIPVTTASEVESLAVGKKRVAHAGAFRSAFDPPVLPKRKETVQEQLFKRFQAMQESKNISGSSSNISVPCANSNQQRISSASTGGGGGSSSSSSGKRRIAHVANAGALVKPPTSTTSGDVPSSQKTDAQLGSRTNGVAKASAVTLSQTVGKGERRVAHVSTSNTSSTVSAPKITPDSKGKVPALVRQSFLDQIYRECLQLCPDQVSASVRAVEEEKALLAKCNTKQVYRCSATNLISRLRKEYRESNLEFSSQSMPASVNRTVSHSDILAGKTGNVSWSIEKKATFNPVGTQLYARMKDYLMSTAELIDNGYPRKCPSSYKGCSGLAIIKQREDTTYSRVIEDSSRKACDRCGTSYLVTEDGFAVNKELCTYHTGRRFGRRTRTGNAETRYNCCDGDTSSVGCCTAACHVFSGKSPDDLKNFICAALEAGEDSKMGAHVWDIIGVDCEMVYTTRGTELARATFVSADGKVIYDTLVKPAHPVLDYNTRYSGIDESMLENTTTSMKEVHLKILANVKPNTIIRPSIQTRLAKLECRLPGENNTTCQDNSAKEEKKSNYMQFAIQHIKATIHLKKWNASRCTATKTRIFHTMKPGQKISLFLRIKIRMDFVKENLCP